MIKVFSLIALSLLVLVGIQGYFFGYNQFFLEDMIVGLVSSIIMLFPTIFILDRLIKKHNIKREKELQKNRYFETLTKRHDMLSFKLENSFLHFVTKVPPQFFTNAGERKANNRLSEVTTDLDRYITKDFVKTNYEVIYADPINITKFHDGIISYQKFCKYQFKDEILKFTNDFISRYMLFIPKDLLESIFKIEDLLKADVLVVPEDHGLETDISNAEFKPELMLPILEEIGNEIIKIKDYSK